MDFLTVPWWGYGLAVLAAVGFGALQCFLTRRAVFSGKPKVGMMALKFALWLAVLVGLAFLSLPILVVFVAVATAALMSAMALLYYRKQKEEKADAA
ncbi:MAG: hypothetical protein PHI98_12400 [Eubacteriales bacterium]|nr:hypothetical protein [Eubacteriales bacterium]